MDRPATSCDFCGDSQVLREYLMDHGDIKWYACATCTRIIEREEWVRLSERSFAAHAQLRPVPCSEESTLRTQVENHVAAFRSVRLVAV